MLVEIDADEWYPVYSVLEHRSGGYCQGVEVPDDVLARWKAVEDAFSDVQDEMEKYLKLAYKDKD